MATYCSTAAAILRFNAFTSSGAKLFQMIRAKGLLLFKSVSHRRRHKRNTICKKLAPLLLLPFIFIAPVNVLFVAAVNHPGNIRWFCTWRPVLLFIPQNLLPVGPKLRCYLCKKLLAASLTVASLTDPHIPTGAAYVQRTLSRDEKEARCLTCWPLCKHPCDTFPPLMTNRLMETWPNSLDNY